MAQELDKAEPVYEKAAIKSEEGRAVCFSWSNLSSYR